MQKQAKRSPQWAASSSGTGPLRPQRPGLILAVAHLVLFTFELERLGLVYPYHGRDFETSGAERSRAPLERRATQVLAFARARRTNCVRPSPFRAHENCARDAKSLRLRTPQRTVRPFESVGVAQRFV